MSGGLVYEVRPARNGEHYWVAIAANGEVAFSSLPETYTREEDAHRSIEQTVAAVTASQPIVVREGARHG